MIQSITLITSTLARFSSTSVTLSLLKSIREKRFCVAETNYARCVRVCVCVCEMADGTNLNTSSFKAASSIIELRKASTSCLVQK